MDLYNLESEDVNGIIIDHDDKGTIIQKPFIDISVYKNNQQLRIIGSSKFKDMGTRPLYSMRFNDQIDVDLSNINEELFMKTLASYRDFERQTVLKYIYKKKAKISRKIKRDIPEQKMVVPEKSYSNKEP